MSYPRTRFEPRAMMALRIARGYFPEQLAGCWHVTVDGMPKLVAAYVDAYSPEFRIMVCEEHGTVNITQTRSMIADATLLASWCEPCGTGANFDHHPVDLRTLIRIVSGEDDWKTYRTTLTDTLTTDQVTE